MPVKAVEEIVTKEAEFQKAQLLQHEEKSMEIMETDFIKAPIDEEKASIIEGKENIERPIQKVVKTKRVPKKKDESVDAIEEIKPEDMIEVPAKEIIKEKEHVTETADILEEIAEEIRTDIPKKEKAKTIVEDRKETIMVTKINIQKSDVKVPEKELDIQDEIIETIETPTIEIIEERKLTKDQHEQIFEETIQKPVEETKIIETEEISKIIEMPTKKKIKRKKIKSTEDTVPEEIVEEMVLEKPEMEQAQTIFSPKEGIEVMQILTESSIIKFTEDEAVLKEAAVCEIEKEESTLKKILREETNTVPVHEEITIETTKEILSEKPKEEEIKLSIITKEGLKVTETISDTSTKDLLEMIKPIKEKILPVKEEESQVDIKEVTVKKAPKKIKPIYASEQLVEEEIIENMTFKKPIREKAEEIIIANEEIKTTEITSEITTSELDKDKRPQGEQITPIEETDDSIQSTEIIIKKSPLVKKKAIEVKEDRPEEIIEDIKIKKPKKEKAKKDVLLQESVEVSEVTTEIIPEEFVTEKMLIEKKAESSVAPIETAEITEISPAVTDGEKTKKKKPKPSKIDVKEEKEIELTPIEKEEVIQEKEKMVEKIISAKPKIERTETDEVLLKPIEEVVEEIIPEAKIKDILKEKKAKDELKEVKTIYPEEIKEFEKPKKEIIPTEEKLIEPKAIEKIKEKKIMKKKKKKPVKKDDIEEWVEPEYERPVLEPMPEKIQWEPMKKKKEKKTLPESVQKLVPQKIERKEIKPTKLKYIEPMQETVQFGTIKLKKIPIVKKKETIEPTFPKFMLRSRITFINDYPTELQIPKVTYMQKNPVQAGILSRNTEEALQIIKKKYKMPKIPEKDLTELEKLDQEFEELKKVPLEQIEDRTIYERTPKKSQKMFEEPQKLIIGKGDIKQEDKIVQEEIKLKKIPIKKPEQVIENEQKPKEEESVEDMYQKKKEKPKETLTSNEFKPIEFDSTEIEKYIPEEYEMPEKPGIEPVSKPYEPSKKKKPEQDVEQIPLIKGIPKPQELEEEPEVKFRIPTSEKPKDEPETIILKGWKKSKPEEEDEEEHPTKEKDITPTMPKEITDEFTVKQKKKPKKIKEKETKPQDNSEQITLKKTFEEKQEMPTEELIVKRPKKKSESEEKQDEPDISQKVLFKKPKEFVEEKVEDEVTITKQIIEEKGEDVKEVTEEVTLKKKPKKKPVTEESAVEITVKKPVPTDKEHVPEEISEQLILKKPKEESLKEEVADEVTIKKPVVEETKEVAEEVTLKKKPKKKPVTEESSAEITVKKPVPKEEEQVPEEISEKVVLKKPKKESLKEEVAEVTIKKPVVEEIKEVAEEVTLKKKPKKKPVIEEPDAEITIKKSVPKEGEQVPEEVSKKVILTKPKKVSPKEEVADEVTIKKPVVEKEVEDVEEVTLRSKPRKKMIETEEISEVIIAKPVKDKIVEEEIIEASADVLLKEKEPVPKIEDVITEELTIRKIEVVEQPEEVIEEFTLKRKPPKKVPKPIEEIYEDVTLRKLRPKKKSRLDIKEVTEVENVTFRPRTTKRKEDVEQEFKISLNTYEEEDISMSGKVRLKPKRRPLTYSEETGEETIKIIQEIEDDSGPIIEEIIDESDGEGKEEYSIEELDIDEMNVPLRQKKKKQKAPYTVEEIEEDDVKLQLKRDRKYSYEETDAESLALKLKSKRRISTFEEGLKMAYIHALLVSKIKLIEYAFIYNND